MLIIEDSQTRRKRLDFAKQVIYRLRYMIKQGLSDLDKEIVNSPYFESSYYIPLEIPELKRRDKGLYISVPIRDNIKLEFEFLLHPNFIIRKDNIIDKKEIEFIQSNAFGFVRNKNKMRLCILFDINDETEFTNYNYHQIMEDKELENNLIHEITHWYDEIRTKGKIKHSDETSNIEEYYNSDDELNAYTQEIIKYITDKLKLKKVRKEKYKDIITNILKSREFYEEYNGVLIYLTRDNKKKLISRIYNYFQDNQDLLESIIYSRLGDIRYKPLEIMIEIYKK